MSLVAIVGRPNVGKSTLFNRLIEAREAIVHNEPGVTRDRHYGSVLWNGVTFNVVDTGGLVPGGTEVFEAAIREQVEIALEETDVILFMVDASVGITDIDQEVAARLRRSEKPVLVVANKSDNDKRRWDTPVFYEFGLGEVYPISSLSGTGTGELLDALTAALPVEMHQEDDTRTRVSLIGKPNVGKSSITNALLGENRSIVTEIAGTTRDSVHATYKFYGEELVLVDTAGLRKRAKVKENVEFYSLLRTERAIQEADVAVLIIDATQGLEAQDIRVLKQAEDMNKGLLIAVNKWDLMQKETNTARDYAAKIYERLQTLDYVPIIFISAITKQRLHNMMEKVVAIAAERKRRIPTSALNDYMQDAIRAVHPPAYRGNFVKIKYVTQVRENPPVFAFFVNHPDGVAENYRRYLEGKLREKFGFAGVPITLAFKQK
ncbi:MAG: ribosome biogenesis GTPase Der [Bacteroidetes Order II. Incertae sedis bacterium]|nr:ribosome biogenesis GTPase Der [Bacteroidetes Order II. bacterium]